MHIEQTTRLKIVLKKAVKNSNMEDVTKWYRHIPYEFLQILIDMYVERKRCDRSFMILLDEKLKRNEIYA